MGQGGLVNFCGCITPTVHLLTRVAWLLALAKVVTETVWSVWLLKASQVLEAFSAATCAMLHFRLFAVLQEAGN